MVTGVHAAGLLVVMQPWIIHCNSQEREALGL